MHEYASENIVCEMAAILSKGRWINLISAGAMHEMYLDLTITVPCVLLKKK